MKSLNKNINQIVSALNRNPKNNKKKRNRPRNRKNRTNRALPAAYTTHVRARFMIESRNSNRCVVSGCDLVYAIPTTLAASGDTIFTVIPCNPAYWSGTRIARIAPAYQNYRPLQFRVSYIPQVAVTQAGTVFMGTLWDEAAPTQNIQQSLVTSNGGQLTQCYIPADSNITLGRNLQQNLFKITGALSTDTNPFIFLAGVRGASVVPGYFYVTYRYEFKNPIGEAWTFINSGLSTIGALPAQEPAANGTIILLNQLGSLGPGTQLDRESNGIFYHGSPIELDDQTQIIYFNNFQTSLQTTARMTSGIYIDTITVDSVSYPISTFTPGTGTLAVPPDGQMFLILSPHETDYRIRLFNGQSTIATTDSFALVPRPSGQFELSLSSNNKTVTTIDMEPIETDNLQDFYFSKIFFTI